MVLHPWSFSLIVTVILLLCVSVNAFLGSVFQNGAFHSKPISFRKETSLFVSSPLDRLEEGQARRLIAQALQLDDSNSLLSVKLVGQASLAAEINGTKVTCAVVATGKGARSGEPEPCLLLSLSNPKRDLALLASAATASSTSKALSKTELWLSNTALVNRDDGLYDNLPYSTWTKDSSRQFRDAAGNPVTNLFHPGKREFYNRMTGKDWNDRPSRAVAQLAMQISTNDDTTADKDEMEVLKRRLAGLQVQELEMDVAECDYQLALALQQQEDLTDLEEARQTAVDQLESARQVLADLEEPTKRQNNNLLASGWVQSLAETGNTDARSVDASSFAYPSSYHMVADLIREQLHAQVIATVLEDASLLTGSVVPGGVIVLSRLTTTRSIQLAGETLQVSDDEETYGNDDVTAGQVFVVECHADEAIGMSLACDLPLQVESGLWKAGAVMAAPSAIRSGSSKTSLDIWQALDPELTVLVEGQASNRSMTERVSPVRMPASSASLFDRLYDQTQETKSSPPLFPLDNPIQSVEQYDNLSVDAKARTLLSMSNYNGKLPRPRVLREAPTALDDVLLPLIDESVRRQVQIRQAARAGDWDLVQTLESEKSSYQAARERADKAREAGDEETALYWEEEASVLKTLRADITQDEGSYSRFLDRDDWYERERQRTASRVDRAKFGNLLDGIE